MNWYKKSQQRSFDFFQSIPETFHIPIEKTDEYQKIKNQSIEFLKEILKTQNGYENIIRMLKNYGFQFRQSKSDEKPNIIIHIGESVFIIDDFEHPVLKNL